MRRFLQAVRGRATDRSRAAAQIIRLWREAGTGLLLATTAVNVVLGLLPLVFMVSVGIAIQRVTGAGAANAEAAGWWLPVALAAFLAQQALSPAQLVLSGRIARQVDAYCSARLIRSAVIDAALPTVETDQAITKLSEAHEALSMKSATPGAAAEGALALITRYTQLFGAVALIAVTWGPWSAIGAACLAFGNRQGQTSAFRAWGKVVRSFASSRRRVTYVRDLATSTRAAKEIRTLGLLTWLDAMYERSSRAYLEPLWTRRRQIYGTPFTVYAGLTLLVSVIVLGVHAYRAAGQPAEIDLAALTIGIQAVVLCVRFGVIFPEADVKMVYGRVAWEAMLGFEEVARQQRPARLTVAGPMGPPRESIRFERACFAYPGGEDVLTDLDLILPVGRSTALVGVNGAGKTTLVKLLSGLYRPVSGSIISDGRSIADLDPQAWQSHFAVTFQDFIRYELSLRDNVAVGGDRDDEEGIVEALTQAGLGNLLSDLPEGLDTPLTSALRGGRDLSGGQWQRVALARSLFSVRSGASILILDEPTAQLDARGEAEFYDTFLELTRGVTTLIISHRFSSVRLSDNIVVLDGGRVVESGTHVELRAEQGLYARLFEAQASRFADVGGAP